MSCPNCFQTWIVLAKKHRKMIINTHPHPSCSPHTHIHTCAQLSCTHTHITRLCNGRYSNYTNFISTTAKCYFHTSLTHLLLQLQLHCGCACVSLEPSSGSDSATHWNQVFSHDPFIIQVRCAWPFFSHRQLFRIIIYYNIM